MEREQKIAEKLLILNKRGQGLLIRLYNVKKALEGKARPVFLSDKQVEPVIKSIVRKFPTLDTKPANTVVIEPLKKEIIDSFGVFYETLDDIMDFKFHLTTFLTYIDTWKMYLDITVNFDMTCSYLDLIVTYTSLMIILSRVEDRKIVVGLYHVAMELTKTNSGPHSYGRLAQMLDDFDPLFKSLSKQLVHHGKRIIQAILSLASVYKQRSKSAEERRRDGFLSLLKEPNKITQPPESNLIACEYLSMTTMERWITVGLLICYQQLHITEVNELWKLALQGGYVITLCRDEVLNIHVYTVSCLESIKGLNRKASEVKDLYQKMAQSVAKSHKDQRNFLRTALKELVCIFTDRPGLLAPKILHVLQALSAARDEVIWLMKHSMHPPPKKISVRWRQQEYEDRQIPELLFLMEELRVLVRKYSDVIHKYYDKYISGYDAIQLNALSEDFSPSDEETELFDYISLAVNHELTTCDGLDEYDESDDEDGGRGSAGFSGMRLDWFRLQTLMSCDATRMIQEEVRGVARLLNTMVFHTKMVDGLMETVEEVSSLSEYCFYVPLLGKQFDQCVEFPPQMPYAIAFPRLCGQFIDSCHELCPEERHLLCKRSTELADWMMKKLIDEAIDILSQLYQGHAELADKTLPKHCTVFKGTSVKSKGRDDTTRSKKPGVESRRLNLDPTPLDKLQMALAGLCAAINHWVEFEVWGHKFLPIDYFKTRLNENMESIIQDVVKTENHRVAKPSEVKVRVDAVVSVILRLENHLFLEVPSVLQACMQQHTQPMNSKGVKNTLTMVYTRWFVEVFLAKVNTVQLLYSPLQKQFINCSPDSAAGVEEYADYIELCALSSVIGPYGMLTIKENLMANISKHLMLLMKYVAQHRETLMEIRHNLHAPDQVKELMKRLATIDGAVQNVVCIGSIMCFHDKIQEALADVFGENMVFISTALEDLASNEVGDELKMSADILASSAGIKRPMEPGLIQAVASHRKELLPQAILTLMAVAIPKLACGELPSFKRSVEEYVSIIHCLAKGISELTPVMWAVYSAESTTEQLEDFITMVSYGLLKVTEESDKTTKYTDATVLIIEKIVEESPYLSMDHLQKCVPYVLLQRANYHVINQVD